MKMIVTATSRIGPFNSVEQTENGWLANGEVEYQTTVIGDAHIEEAIESDMPQPLIVVNPRHITKLAFRNRFGQSEKVEIELAACDSPSGTTDQRTLAAGVRASLADLAAAAYIDLDREDTRAGVVALETWGILAAGRALEILDAEIQAVERFMG